MQQQITIHTGIATGDTVVSKTDVPVLTGLVI